eukprot:m.10871 g.10871  ORF g.10871 m.10871 type:complete len:481 (+) comp7992_c0_seq1:260-1702(+)
MMAVGRCIVIFTYCTFSILDISACPCSDQSLCNPVTRVGHENVYAFHTTGSQNWRDYDWNLITTICVFGSLDPELLCHAHSYGTRVTFGTGGLEVKQWHNDTAVQAWINASVTKVTSAYADGFNIDIEHAASDPEDIAALTALTKQATDAMHAVNPHAHVTFDVPSAGLLQEGCGNQYGRAYDFKSMAEIVDFFVVMDYDSGTAGSAVGHLQHYLPTSSPSYVYENRTAAAAACAAANFSRLCTKQEIHGFDHCAKGWCSDFEGYWMTKSQPGCGSAGYNAGVGAAGAYCCDPARAAPCSTCYFANAALPVVSAGVDCYARLGVPAGKLVLAFPWYGYDYTCAAGSTLDTCRVVQARQIGYPEVQKLLTTPSVVQQWLPNTSTPYFGYYIVNGTLVAIDAPATGRGMATGVLHRVEYDDPRSLRLKYALARNVSARGVGMWTASTLNYSDVATARQFWTDLRIFNGTGTRGGGGVEQSHA